MTAEVIELAERETSQTLRDVIRARIGESDVADPASLLEAVLAELSEEQITEAARYGIKYLLGTVTRELRRGALGREGSLAGSPKWNGVARAARERPDLFSARIVVGYDAKGHGVHAFLGDCDAHMLAAAESVLREQSAKLGYRADQYARLRAKLKDKEPVRSLGLETVRRVLDA